MSGEGDYLFGGEDRGGGLDGFLANLEGRAGRRAARQGAAALLEDLEDGGADGGEESAAAVPGDRIIKIADTVR